jgi:transcriptional regulator with XRE-family HTH domain
VALVCHYLSVDEIERDIRRRIEAASRRLGGEALPEPATVKEVLAEIDLCLADLGEAMQVKPELSSLVRLTVLQAAFPVLLAYRHGAPDLAWHLFITEWEQVVYALSARGWGGEVREGRYSYALPLNPLTDPSGDQELLVLFNLAVFEILRGSQVQGRGREAVRRLMSRLALSYDQLGRAFGVSGETVRRWERGSHPIPDERLADLSEAEGALGRLEGMFRPERLPQVVRRKAELFDGEAALDWILRGRIGAAADRYEAILAYQA